MTKNTPHSKTKHKAPHPVYVHFLGTCSGGGPTTSRQCSSLAVDFGNNIWLFDAADGTNNRLHGSPLRMINISRIFITHMHADHILGIVAILGVIMSGVGQTPEGLDRLRKQGLSKKPDVNIYGPVGLRAFIRNILHCTAITLNGAYAVHELVPEGSAPSTECNLDNLHVNEGVGMDIRADADGMWPDIIDERPQKGVKGWCVSAGPLVHRVPAVGYVLTEAEPREPLDTARLVPLIQANATALAQLDPPVKHPLSLLSHLTSLPPPEPYVLPSGDVLHPPQPTGAPPRKLVIFGDCNGGTPNAKFQEYCTDASLLVHECTNAAIPESVQKGVKGRLVRASQLEQSLERKREKEFAQAARDKGVVREPWVFHGKHATEEHEAAAQDEFETQRLKVRTKARSRGHSTPQDVGEFAHAIRARRVAVNHFSAMFPSPRYAHNIPFPSLLSPASPYPYPVGRAVQAPQDPVPLTANELHIRLIMQSLANQISADWNGPECRAPTPNAEEPQCITMAVPSRDYMIYRVPSHELAEDEIKAMRELRKEAEIVMRSWANDGGVYVEEGGKKRWVGVDPEPVELLSVVAE